MLIVPTTFKSVSIRSFVKMNLHSDCHAVLSINVSTLLKIVISRFLERPQSEVAGTSLFTGACPNKIARQRVSQKFRVPEHTRLMSQSALKFCPIHCPNGRLGQDLGFGGIAFALKLPELVNRNLPTVRAKLGQTSCFPNGPQIWCPIG